MYTSGMPKASGKRPFSGNCEKTLSTDFNLCWRVFALAEELSVLDADAPLWNAARSLLDIAFRLEQNAETYLWHGWNKQQIDHFLRSLPTHCTLLVGVWEPIVDGERSVSSRYPGS